MVLPLFLIQKAGGFTTGGFNFDAKVRRQSLDAADLFHAHVGAIDETARALLVVEKMMQDGKLEKAVADRYQGWSGPLGKEILSGKASLESLSKHVLDRGQDVAPVSGRQEALENLVNRYL
jgi:xylose isomerase